MSLVLAPPAADPISIDAGVTYQYVIAVTGATGVGFKPSPYFTLSVSGVTLSVRFNLAPPLAPTIYPVVVFANSASGTQFQTLNFQVGLPIISSASTLISLQSVAGSSNYKFTGDAVLAVHDALYVPGSSLVLGAINNILYVVAVDPGAGTLQLSISQGGSALTATTNTGFSVWVCTSANGYSSLWVGDTSHLTVGELIKIGSPTGMIVAMDGALTGNVYVKTIADAWHIQVSATSGGTAIDGTTDAYTTGKIEVAQANVRRFPAITSPATAAAAAGGTLSYAITTDISADSFQAGGLPAGLSISGTTISGSVPNQNLTVAVLVSATLNGNVFSRYLVLIIGTGSALAASNGGFVGGGIVPTSSGKIFFDGDFTVAQLAGPAEFEIPFKADPKPYAYRLKYWQFLASFVDTPFDSPGPLGGFCVGGTPGTFKEIGGGVIEFWREFALVPDTRSEYESFVYRYQFYFPLIGRTGTAEIPITTQSRIQFDYFHTTSPESIFLPKAPVMWAPGVVFFLNGWLGIALSATGTEVLGEDATMKQWKGNIYERRQRFIQWINPNDILFS